MSLEWAKELVVCPCDCCRYMSVEEAGELGGRSIYHATFRDCASGGTVSGGLADMLVSAAHK